MTPVTLRLAGRDWRADSLAVPLPGKGQDAFALGAGSAAVVDGATPLDDDWPQDVGRFATRAATALVENGDSDTLSLADVWAGTVMRLRAEFEPAGYRRTAGAVLVRSAGEELEVSAAGDVACLVESDNGARWILDPTLPSLDREAEEAENERSALIAHRRLANAADGYAVIGDDPSVAERVLVSRLPVEAVARVWLLSDGFWRVLPEEPAEAAAELPRREEQWRSGVGVAALTDDATLVRLERLS